MGAIIPWKVGYSGKYKTMDNERYVLIFSQEFFINITHSLQIPIRKVHTSLQLNPSGDYQHYCMIFGFWLLIINFFSPRFR